MTTSAPAFFQAFIFTLAYTQNNDVYESAAAPAQFRDVVVSNVSVDGAATSIRVDGFDAAIAQTARGSCSGCRRARAGTCLTLR